MSLDRSAQISNSILRGLHPRSIADQSEVIALLERAKRSGAVLSRGLNHRLDIETARIVNLSSTSITLDTSGFRRSNRPEVFLNFNLDGAPYFFLSEAIGSFDGNLLRIRVPDTIYSRERRDRLRAKPNAEQRFVRILTDDSEPLRARVEDVSPEGLGISVPSEKWETRWKTIRLNDSENSEIHESSFASVRSRERSATSGWTRIGLVRTTGPVETLLPQQDWETISEGVGGRQSPESPPNDSRSETANAEFVQFTDRDGRHVAGFVDKDERPGRTTAVILQTGWGETKEALLPLARTIVDTFSAHGESIVVLRMDGVNQRGESYKEPGSRLQGREYNHFGFSQPVRDIEAGVNFLKSHHSPDRTILVSQSIAALAGRKFIALDEGRTVDGWICIVGAPDLQSASRSISGGVDFAIGYDNGIEFGYQELLGVMIHADRMMKDATEIGVLHIDSARRDFSHIKVPITWFHGRYDAWVDLERVREAMSHGPLEKRKLITLPLAHRLGWSKTAGEAFRTFAYEISKMALGEGLQPIPPDREDLSKRRAWERSRRPKLETDLRQFWKDYLLGRDGSVGIELMTACSPYGSLIADQVELLDPQSGDLILDMGCGTGPLLREIEKSRPTLHNVSVVGLDLVPEALMRGRKRRRESRSLVVSAKWLAADLDVVEGHLHVPFADATFSSLHASLLLSYVERPVVLLREAFRVLRPGGSITLSSLLKDADISRLYVESLAELTITDAESYLPELEKSDLDNVARNFLNDAARILELEAEGSFVFWEPGELADLLKEAGFIGITSKISFGNPGQAVIVRGYRP